MIAALLLLALDLSVVERAVPEDPTPAEAAELKREVPACFVDGEVKPCSERRKSLVGECAVRALVGRGVDITATAIAINAGAVELNKIQPTVEHRVGISMLLIGSQIEACSVIERKAGPKWARRASRAAMFLQFAAGAWNIGQAFKAERRAR